MEKDIEKSASNIDRRIKDLVDTLTTEFGQKQTDLVDMSKNQLKKLKNKLIWERDLPKLKKQKKERLKAKKKALSAKVAELKKEGKDASHLIAQIPRRGKRSRTFKKEMTEKLKDCPPIIIDCSFEAVSEPKEITSLVNQLTQILGSNKYLEQPLNLIVTGVGPKTMDHIKDRDGDKWLMDIRQEDYLSIYPKEQLVYLSGDAEEEVETIEEGKIYIIGGLVDHNRLKNITLEKAKKQGIKLQRFKIEGNVKLNSRSILSVNQCFDIVHRLYNGRSMRDSLLESIPKRKLVISGEDEKLEGNTKADIVEEVITGDE